MININNMSVRVPASSDANLAVAKIPHIRRSDSITLARTAVNLGFTAVATNQYQHSDGSWVIMTAQGTIERGVGSARFQGMIAAQQAQAQNPPLPNQARQAQQYSQPPAQDWAWYQRNTALGKLPIINATNARATLISHGLSETSPGSWTHPDGTWVTVSGATVRLGWQQWSLGQLPYNNRLGRP